MSTAQQLVTRAMRRLQAIDILSEPSAAEMTHGLAVLSEIINGWSADGIPTYGFTLTGNLTSGSKWVTDVCPNTDRLVKLLNVSGTGVAASSVISSVDGKYCFKLSSAATADGSGVTLTFAFLPVDVRVEGAIIALLAVRLSEDLGLPVSAKLQMDADRGWAGILASMLPDRPQQLDAAILNFPSQRTFGMGTGSIENG